MGFHGAFGHPEIRSDSLVRFALGDSLQDLHLALAKGHKQFALGQTTGEHRGQELFARGHGPNGAKYFALLAGLGQST